MINNFIHGSVNEKAECTGCSACVQICPVNAITMSTDSEHFIYPQIDGTNCIGCNKCESVCPILHKNRNVPSQHIYACYAKDRVVRDAGSSGGLFGIIAETVLDNGGIVYGAAFSEGFVLRHTGVEKKEDLPRLYKSKYLQSDQDGVYPQIKEQLDNGRCVYFCGTPCQVSALKNYLGHVYDRLLTSDIVCHGVPSNRMFIDAIRYEESLISGRITDFNFRVKNNPYKTAHVCKYSYFINDSNKMKTKYKLSSCFPFYNAYLKALTYRHSCYRCPYANTSRAGDITLCDFWRIDEFSDKMRISDGVSGLIVNSIKGESTFTQIKDRIEYEEYGIEVAIKHNGCLSKPTVKPILHDELIKTYVNEGFATATKRFMRPKHIISKKIYFAMPLSLRKAMGKLKKYINRQLFDKVN